MITGIVQLLNTVGTSKKLATWKCVESIRTGGRNISENGIETYEENEPDTSRLVEEANSDTGVSQHYCWV